MCGSEAWFIGTVPDSCPACIHMYTYTHGISIPALYMLQALYIIVKSLRIIVSIHAIVTVHVAIVVLIAKITCCAHGSFSR